MPKDRTQPVSYEDFAAAGYTKAETARAKGVRPNSVTVYAKRHGLVFADGVEAQRKVDYSRLVGLAEDGFSQSTAALILGVSRERVRQIAKRDGIEFLPGQKDYDLRDRVEKLHSQGLKDGEVASVAGCSVHSVYIIRKELGLPNNHTGHSKHEARLRELAAAGFTQTEAAREIGIAQGNVSLCAKRLGITFVDGRTKRWAK